MEKKGAPDYPHSTIIDQLCDAVVSKLTERMNQHLTFNRSVSALSGNTHLRWDIEA